MRMTKKDHTLLWLSRLRLNPGKQMGFSAEGQEEQAWMSSWPASDSKKEKRGSRVPWINHFKRNRQLRLVPKLLQVLHLCKHVDLDRSQLPRQPRPWDSPPMCHSPGPGWAPGEHWDIHRRHIACPVLESKLSEALTVGLNAWWSPKPAHRQQGPSRQTQFVLLAQLERLNVLGCRGSTSPAQQP